MEEKRMTIPKEILEKSNLKDTKKILVTLVGEDILLIPYTEDWKGLKVVGSRALDEKGRFRIPNSLHVSPEELMVYNFNEKEIWITRHI